VGVLPIFVVEGTAPDLKQATMKARNAARHGPPAPSQSETKTKKATRTRFAGVLREVSCKYLVNNYSFIVIVMEISSIFSILDICKI